jgi:stage V sporulation protein B
MRDTMLLTGSSLVMRGIALIFQMWLVSRIGPAGVGLYGLVGSVSFLAATLAISGVRFAATRLISEEIGLERHGGIGRAMRACLSYSLFFGAASACVLVLTAEPIGFLWVGDARTVLSLKILAFSLPFMSLSSVFYGYFAACGRIMKAAAVQFSEQIVRIVLVAVFLSAAPSGDLERSCAAVAAGGTVAEVFSFVLMFIVFLVDRRRHAVASEPAPKIPSRLLKIAAPLALSAYARTSLTTMESLLVPRGLKAAGFSANAALAGYGTITGMVFPMVFFPSCLLTSLAELLVPELTAAQMAGRGDLIRAMVKRLLIRCLKYSLLTGLLMYLLAEPLTDLIYGSGQAGHYLKIFAFLVPIMYMDMVIDGCLKGLGQQVWSMCFNIADAILGVTLVWFLLPQYALKAYIAIIFFEEIFNFTLSFWRLRRVIAAVHVKT